MQQNVPFVASLIVFIISPQPPLLKADILHPGSRPFQRGSCGEQTRAEDGMCVFSIRFIFDDYRIGFWVIPVENYVCFSFLI